MIIADVSSGLRIGNRWYNIKLIPDLHKKEGRNVYGYTNYLLGEIVIEKNLQYDHQVEVLIHEIFHVIEDIYSLPEGEETTKQCLSVCWTQILQFLGINFVFKEDEV